MSSQRNKRRLANAGSKSSCVGLLSLYIFMDIDILVDNIERGNADIDIALLADNITEQLYSEGDIRTLYLALLKSRMYNQIFEIVSLSHILDSSAYRLSSVFADNATSQYFYYLHGLLDVDTLDSDDKEHFYSLMFWVYYADRDQAVSKWKSAVANTLYNYIQRDFDYYFLLVGKYDTALRTIDIALKVNTIRTIKVLVNIYTRDNNRAARRILSQYIYECIEILDDMQDVLAVYQKKRLISLLGVYYDNSLVSNSLTALMGKESNASVIRQIDSVLSRGRKGASRANTSFYKVDSRYMLDSSGTVSFECDGVCARYTLQGLSDIAVEMQGKPRRVTPFSKFKNGLIASITSRISQLERAMIIGQTVRAEDFLSLVESDGFFARACQSIVFAIVDSDGERRPIFVDKDNILSVDNEPIMLDMDCNICILHPVYFVGKYEFLKHQIDNQPIEQIARQVYAKPVDNVSIRSAGLFEGRLIELDQFVDKASAMFATFVMDRVASMATFYVYGYYCILYLDIGSGGMCTIRNVSFYYKKDMSIIKNKLTIDSLSAIPIVQIDRAIYSETMRSITQMLQ